MKTKLSLYFFYCICVFACLTAKGTAQTLEEQIDGISLSKEELMKWVGIYQFSENDVRYITLKEGKLFSRKEGGRLGALEMTPLKEDTFTFDKGLRTYLFSKTKDGKKQVLYESNSRSITGIEIDKKAVPKRKRLNNKKIGSTVKSVGQVIKSGYVFPEIGREIAEFIIANFNRSKYKGLTSRELAEHLTNDTRSINGDKHLRVIFDPKRVAQIRERELKDNLSSELPDEWLNRMRRDNYGFTQVKILEGNIGYLELRGFFDTKYAGKTDVAAMAFLENTDALIIDLRKNGGGSPSMVQLISSYFFEDEPIRLNDFYSRESNETVQSWTLPYVPGVRNAEKKIYVLVGNRTFSAAEGFSYHLKHLNRAIIVGQVTGGGAHPGGLKVATDDFLVWIPSGRAINPITGTNWEGVGVIPNVKVPEDQALSVAHKLALD